MPKLLQQSSKIFSTQIFLLPFVKFLQVLEYFNRKRQLQSIIYLVLVFDV